MLAPVLAHSLTRRSLLAGIGALATSSTLWLGCVVAAQAAAQIRRIGVLLSVTGDLAALIENDFEEQLRKLGHVNGANVRIDFRVAGPMAGRLHDFALELVAAQPDVIVIWGGVRDAFWGISTEIPIVALSDDLVGAGFAKSLARPGGNVTGVSSVSPYLVSKRLQLLTEVAPKIRRVIVLKCAHHRDDLSDLQPVARKLGVTLVPITVRTAEEVETTLARLKAADTDGLLALDCGDIHDQVATALPSSYYTSDAARRGALMSYFHYRPDAVRMLADYVHQILNGAKPVDLPIQQPTRFRLVINLKTAKALGLTIPKSLLLRADEVIQ